MSEDNLSKAELALIDKIIGAVGLAKFRNILWQKVRQAFGFSFHGTNIEYGFARATPDERALAYLKDRIFILSDKTQDKFVGDLRWEMLEGMRNAESIDKIKRRLDGIFKGNTVNTERIARTETLNAMNAGRQNAYEESGVVHYKMWKAAMGNARTAADSKRLNGQLQEVGNPFVDPKTGDAFMHPPNRPNCRCLYENPLVYTIDGWKPINKIIVGELVLTHKGRFRKVTKTHKQSKKEIRYKVTVRYDEDSYSTLLNGLTLTVTPDHPFLTQRGWVEASDLQHDDEISTFAGRCKNCNSLYPLIPIGIGEDYYYKYCSVKCGRSYTATEQWADPNIMKDVPDKISANMKEQYASGERSKERSPEHLAALIAGGTRALKDPKNRAKNWVYQPKEETEDIRNKIREGTAKWREENPEKWEEAKKNMSDARKQLHRDHPEKHVNRILAQKGHETNLERLMRKELDDRNIEYEKQYKIDRFFVDFAISELKIAVECDGDYWHQDEEKDKLRDDVIISNGWDILHFKEGEILSDISKCVDSVERLMSNHDGNYEFMWLPISSVKVCDPPQRARMTWNLSVEEDESFVTKSMVVHNCTTIPMRKLPENIVHKGGQMYAADEIVGKIEIDIGSLNKTEKRVWVKPTSKRKGHYRRVKGAKEEVEKSNNITRIEKIVPIVQLSGMSEDKLGSVASALENTLGKYATNVEAIRWATSEEIERHGDFGAMLTSKFDPGSVSIVINKDIMDNKQFADRHKKERAIFNSIKETQIEYFEDSIKLGMGEKEKYEDKLAGYKVMSRFSVDVGVENPLKCIIEHEGYHAIDFKNAVSSSPTIGLKHAGIFLEALEKNGTTFKDKCEVSEYASRNDTELWAEVGSALLNGVHVPESIKKSFNETLAQLK